MSKNNWYTRTKTRVNDKYLKKPKGFDERWGEKSKASRVLLSFVSGKAVAEKIVSSKEKYSFYKGLFSDLSSAIKSFFVYAYETLQILIGRKKVEKPTDKIELPERIELIKPHHNPKLLGRLIASFIVFLGIYIYSLYVQYQQLHQLYILTPWLLITLVLGLIIFVIKKEEPLERSVKSDLEIAHLRLSRNRSIYLSMWFLILIVYGAYQLNSYRAAGTVNIFSGFTFFFVSYSFYVYRFNVSYAKFSKALLGEMEVIDER